MFSGLIPGLNSASSLEHELSAPIPASLITLLDLPKQLLSLGANTGIDLSFFTRGTSFFRRESPGFGVPLEWRILIFWSGVVIAVALIAWSHYEEEEEAEAEHGGDSVSPLDGESPERDAEASVLALFSNTNGGEILPESDEKYAEELQVQEALLVSLLSSQTTDNVMSSRTQTGPPLIGEPSWSFCDICLEHTESWRMFMNKSCSHSFCHDCTSKHIAAKLQYNIKTILCPGADCKAPLDFDSCREIIPNDVLVRWDESLCKSLIPESQTVFCPFQDCLAMLVNDSGEVVKEIDCPACHRQICARCRVPWHSEFTCEEFHRLNAKKKKGKGDVLVMGLAKKKSWRRCPHCRMYVEKNEGCLHITCRCGHEFCYRCGSKWVKFHGGCRQRSWLLPKIITAAYWRL